MKRRLWDAIETVVLWCIEVVFIIGCCFSFIIALASRYSVSLTLHTGTTTANLQFSPTIGLVLEVITLVAFVGGLFWFVRGIYRAIKDLRRRREASNNKPNKPA